MKKRFVITLTALLLIGILLCTVACSKVSPTTDETRNYATAQQTVDAAISAASAEAVDYTFRTGTEEDQAVQNRAGDADKYVICDNGQTQSLVYIYEDICYDERKSYRYFDVLTPVAKEQLDPNTPVLLYLHGGGWVSGDRKADEVSLLPYLAKAGNVVITMEYALWFGFNQREEADKGVYSWAGANVFDIIGSIIECKTPVSIGDQQADIDACLTYLRDTYLPSLGLNATSIGIGGYSAGAHLTSLYAYGKGDQSPIRLAYLMNMAGPVYMLNETYMYWAELMTGRSKENPEAAQDILDLVQPVLTESAKALAGLLGASNPIDVTTDEGYQQAIDGTAKVQPIDYVKSDSLPTILCYAKQHDESFDFLETLFNGDYDDFIPVSVYYAIEQKLTNMGVVHSNAIFDNLTHLTISTATESCKWIASRVAAYASVYCKPTRAQ